MWRKTRLPGAASADRDLLVLATGPSFRAGRSRATSAAHLGIGDTSGWRRALVGATAKDDAVRDQVGRGRRRCRSPPPRRPRDDPLGLVLEPRPIARRRRRHAVPDPSLVGASRLNRRFTCRSYSGQARSSGRARLTRRSSSAVRRAERRVGSRDVEVEGVGVDADHRREPAPQRVGRRSALRQRHDMDPFGATTCDQRRTSRPCPGPARSRRRTSRGRPCAPGRGIALREERRRTCGVRRFLSDSCHTAGSCRARSRTPTTTCRSRPVEARRPDPVDLVADRAAEHLVRDHDRRRRGRRGTPSTSRGHAPHGPGIVVSAERDAAQVERRMEMERRAVARKRQALRQAARLGCATTRPAGRSCRSSGGRCAGRSHARGRHVHMLGGRARSAIARFRLRPDRLIP